MMLDAQLTLYGLGPTMWPALFPLSLRARQQIWYYTIRETDRSSREQITHDFITTYPRRGPVYQGINSIQGAEDLITGDLSYLITNLQNTNQE